MSCTARQIGDPVALFQRAVVRVEIKASLSWEVARDPETQTWIGICRDLNLNAIGDTWAEFQAGANDAIALLLTQLLRHGQLEKFLRDHGWTPAVPLPARDARVHWDVPYQIKQRSRADELVPA